MFTEDGDSGRLDDVEVERDKIRSQKFEEQLGCLGGGDEGPEGGDIKEIGVGADGDRGSRGAGRAGVVLGPLAEGNSF